MPALTRKQWRERLANTYPTDLATWDTYLAEITTPGADAQMTRNEYQGIRQEVAETAMYALNRQKATAPTH